MQTRWGIDLGGTKIEGVVLGPGDHRQVLSRRRIATEAEGGYGHILHRIVRLVDELKVETGLAPEAVGVGTPGTLDPGTQTLKNSNTLCLNGMPVRRDLEAALGVPVRIANDANCFALAEARLGAARERVPDAEVVFGVIMGTGVGGGLVVHNRVINGRQGIGGEWGHNFLHASGGPCYCGKTGCVEMVLAGPALERYYAGRSGTALKLPQIVERYRQGGDPHAEATIRRMIDFFGQAISVVINIADPDAIVIGGGVGNIDLLYTEGVEAVRKYVFNNRLDTVFLKPLLGDSAGVFGAAMLVG